MRTLSGGNQQKVVLAKWLAATPDMLVLDEPTAGIDIGSKSEIIALIRELARAGKAIILISSELSELLAASDRIVVMSDGRITGEIARVDFDDAGAAGEDPGMRLQAAERKLQIVIQQALTRSEQVTMSTSETANDTLPDSRLGLANWRQNIIYIGFVVIFIVFAVTLHDKGFLEPNNLLNIVRQTAMIAVMAVAMTYVLSAGEIDLSVGARGRPCVGRDGDGDRRRRAALRRARRACDRHCGRHRQRPLHDADRHTLVPHHACHDGHRQGRRHVDERHRRRSDHLAQLSLVLRRRRHRTGPDPADLDARARRGRPCRATQDELRPPGAGDRRQRDGGALFSGIDTRSIKFRVLVISSMAAALAGMLYAGRLQSGRFQLGEGDELSVIAAAVLGGTSLFGGIGTVVGTIVGALMIGLINNGLILMGLEFSQQLIARGGIIILAVAISQSRK